MTLLWHVILWHWNILLRHCTWILSYWLLPQICVTLIFLLLHWRRYRAARGHLCRYRSAPLPLQRYYQYHEFSLLSRRCASLSSNMWRNSISRFFTQRFRDFRDVWSTCSPLEFWWVLSTVLYSKKNGLILMSNARHMLATF